MNRGLYIAVFYLPAAEDIRVGSLGVFRFEAGVYYYVGSAQRNVEARLARHALRRKPLHWHVDFLSVRARMLGAMVLPGARAECDLAQRLGALFPRSVTDFGASDCGCGGHLFYMNRWL